MWRSVLFLLGLALLVNVPYGVAAQKTNSTGKFVEVEKKSRDKVDMYLVNTPVTTAVPYFVVTVEFGDTDYVAEYTPRHSDEELPDSWKAGENVQGRVDKHHIYLERPGGSELQLIVTKRIPVSKKKS
jgi:hypothetical protein